MTNELYHLDPNIKRFCYGKIAEDGVSSDLLERAREMTAFVCADLPLLNPPTIVWIRPVEPSLASAILGSRTQDFRLEERNSSFTRLKRNILGGYTPGSDLHEIWIRSDLVARPNLEFVVAHELRHAWQKLNDVKVFQDECESERDAYRYGYDVLERYLDAKGEYTTELRDGIDQKRAEAENRYQDCGTHASETKYYL